MSQRRYADGYRKLRRADAPRRVAFEVLSEVTSSGAFANIVLPKALRRIRRAEPVAARAAAFASGLVHGPLRARGRLDWALARHVNRPLGDLDPRVLDLLRLGAHQLLDMRVPDHAAVSATVDVAREHLTDGPVRMVNAVLRALAREEVGRIDEEIARIEDGDARLAVAHSHPEWMVRALRAALAADGYDEAELEDVARGAVNEAPVVSLAARPGLIGVEELCEEAEDVLSARVATGLVSRCAVLLASGDPARLPSIRQGLAGVQDEGSQLAAQICAGAPLDGQGDSSWLDLCAGPGGKAALLGALAAGRGAHVVANEIHPHRARLVERPTPALGTVEVLSGAGRLFGWQGPQWPLGSFDRVLVDAPCTGMGSMRRRPESRWRRAPGDVDGLVELQERLLDRAGALPRPGGVMPYVTCSPHRRATRDQVAPLLGPGGWELLDTVALADSVAVEPLAVPDRAGRVDGGGAGRTLQLWGHRHGTDSMFVAALRRL